jgi:penicillin-binding protein 1C
VNGGPQLRDASHGRDPSPSPLAGEGEGEGSHGCDGARRPIRRALCGLGLAALLVTVGGLTALWRDLPAPDLSPTSQRSTTVVDREGRLLRAFTTDEGRWRLPLTLDEVDPRFIALLTAFEDKRFARHAGVDPLAMLRAGGQWLQAGEIVSGGSTLTMQVARLMAPREGRSLTGKLVQMRAALALERHLGKDEILALYLALAPYGGNLEGLRAASWSWLGKEPRRLTLAERALLVALPQSPETRRPDRSPERNLARLRAARDRVIDRAVAAGLASAEEAEAARMEPLPEARRGFPQLAAHVAERLVERENAPQRIRTTLDARWQQWLEALLRERVVPLGPAMAGAIVVVEHATGAVRAHVGGLGLHERERAGALDLANAVRSPGSALKPFIYALAFEQGVAHPETLLQDRPARFGSYAPENFDQGFQGTATARVALQQSLNLPAIGLLAEIGPQRLVSRLQGAGAGLAFPADGQPGLALGLGGVGIRLTNLAGLYAGLARGGETLPLRWTEQDATAEPRRLSDPLAAWYVADILRGAPPPANAPAGRIAYKTGTSYGYRDAWAVGFDRRHTIAVWVGRPDNASAPGLVARQVAAPILFDAFQRIGVEPDASHPPPGAILARTAALPAPLRHIRRDIAKTESAAARAALSIAFPPDGAVLDLAASGGGGEGPAHASRMLAVKALGGVAPLTWLVDGAVAGPPTPRRDAHLAAPGAGFVRLTVLDAAGASAAVTVRLVGAR